ncbi:hypothetical protein MMC29_004691 [Sticta canariensis]|nr:hypothetical protein [Sticta canariensis]
MQSSNDTALLKGGLGTITYNSYLYLPIPPNIVAEWTSLIPLVAHLASYRHDHQLAGEAALTGHLNTSLFPRLGVLDGISRLLAGGPDFLDRVSTMGEVNNHVWDVNWGSAFPCANGAASSILTAYALSYAGYKSFRMPEKVATSSKIPGPEQVVDGIPKSPSISKDETPGITTNNIQKEKRSSFPGDQAESAFRKPEVGLCFRRYKTLHVIVFGRQKLSNSHGWYHRVDQVVESSMFKATKVLLLLGIVVVLFLCDAFGTAVLLLIGLVTQVMCQFLKVQRPPGFLGNNENHNACMLLSSHANSSTWYLYIGDRGVVDSLLNKTMFSIPSFGKVLTHWFRTAHVIQLLAMTFVAAQKGWDGIALLALLISAHAMNWRYGKNQLARRWLVTEGVCVKAKSFEFTGRTAMLGAIHKMSGTKAMSWMDEIMPPVPRRQVWLNRLGKGWDETSFPDPAFVALSRFDQDWVLLHSGLATQAADILRNELDDKSWA